MHLGINGVQIVEHRHVLVEVMEGHVPILRHHQIQANKARMGRRQLESQENLREHNLVRQPPQYLIEITHGDAASGSSLRRPAFHHVVGAGFVGFEFLVGGRSHILQSRGQQTFAHLPEVVGPFRLRCDLSRLPSVGRVHELDVLQMVLSRAIRRRRHALAHVSVKS